MKEQELIDLVQQTLPDAEVIPEGADCNFSLTVISDSFDVKRPVARQQLVLGVFNEQLRSGALHALSVKAMTKSEWEEQVKNQQKV